MEIQRLTKASDEDAFLLSHIAQAAKAHWDYPPAWLALWKEDLTFQAAYINKHTTYTVQDGNRILGFTIIISEENFFQIEHCWISPEHIGKGLGKTLLKEVLSLKAFHNQVFKVLSDPNAVGFYEKFGFQTIEMVPAEPKGRELPLMIMSNSSI